MATYTSNYGWTKPSGSDNVDISVLNDNLDDQDSVIHNAFLNMAVPFSELSTYAVDDIVLYDTGLYKCHTAVVTPGSWTGSTNWQTYKLSEGGGGGLTLGETSSTAYRGDRGKTAYDHSQLTSGNPHHVSKTDVGLGNVPNVSTNDQKPTFTEASTRNNIASGEKLSVIMGKIQKFFNDLKSVAFSGSYTDLTNTPSLATVATSGSYADLSNKPQINGVTLSGNKTTSDLGINADNVMLSDGVTSVEDIVSGTFTAAKNVTILHTKVRKQLNIVSLDIFCQKDLTANQWNHVGDISANFAPDTYNMVFPALNNTDNGVFEAKVQGTSIEVYPNVSGTKNFSIVTTYITTN